MLRMPCICCAYSARVRLRFFIVRNQLAIKSAGRRRQTPQERRLRARAVG
jgi:hypothetical protein